MHAQTNAHHNNLHCICIASLQSLDLPLEPPSSSPPGSTPGAPFLLTSWIYPWSPPPPHLLDLPLEPPSSSPPGSTPGAPLLLTSWIYPWSPPPPHLLDLPLEPPSSSPPGSTPGAPLLLTSWIYPWSPPSSSPPGSTPGAPLLLTSWIYPWSPPPPHLLDLPLEPPSTSPYAEKSSHHYQPSSRLLHAGVTVSQCPYDCNRLHDGEESHHWGSGCWHWHLK